MRKDNRSHGLALWLKLALATEKGRELDAFYRALLASGVMAQRSPKEVTAAHDA